MSTTTIVQYARHCLLALAASLRPYQDDNNESREKYKKEIQEWLDGAQIELVNDDERCSKTIRMNHLIAILERQKFKVKVQPTDSRGRVRVRLNKLCVGDVWDVELIFPPLKNEQPFAKPRKTSSVVAVVPEWQRNGPEFVGGEE